MNDEEALRKIAEYVGTQLPVMFAWQLPRVVANVKAMSENLTATQARCTELLLENRELKKRLAEQQDAIQAADACIEDLHDELRTTAQHVEKAPTVVLESGDRVSTLQYERDALRVYVKELEGSRADWKARYEQAQGYIDGEGLKIVEDLRAKVRDVTAGLVAARERGDEYVKELNNLRLHRKPPRPLAELSAELRDCYRTSHQEAHDQVMDEVAALARKLGAW